jgi:hypothetical protein
MAHILGALAGYRPNLMHLLPKVTIGIPLSRHPLFTHPMSTFCLLMMFTDCLLLILPEHRIVFNLIGLDWILRIIGKSFLYVKEKVAQDVGGGCG